MKLNHFAAERLSLQSLGLLVLGAGLLLGGCRASVNANINTKNDIQETVDFEREFTPKMADDSSWEGDDGVFALNGARHDIALSEESRQQASACSCLSAKVGHPSDPAFVWQGAIPRTDPNSQLVFAMSSEGKTCAGEPEDSLGASYWGYRQEGDDIIIVLENARFGRPLTAGAVIPKPLGNGQIYITPASKSVPYGKSTVQGERYCRVH